MPIFNMPFESKRLFYERVTEKHAAELKDVLCDPTVYAHVDDGAVPSFDELTEAFASSEEAMSNPKSDEVLIDLIIKVKVPKTAIGRLESLVVEQRAEVSYMIGASYWRQGYGSEALNWLQEFLVSNYEVNEFWAAVTPGNEASRQLLVKQGYSEVFSDLPQLASYDQNDWVFRKTAIDGDGGTEPAQP